MLSMDLFTAAGRGTAPPRAQPYPRSYQSNSFVRRRVPPPTLFRFLVPTSTDERIRVEQAKPGPGLRAEPGSPQTACHESVSAPRAYHSIDLVLTPLERTKAGEFAGNRSRSIALQLAPVPPRAPHLSM